MIDSCSFLFVFTAGRAEANLHNSGCPRVCRPYLGEGAWGQPEAKAGADDAETAADGVFIISVSNASGCGDVLQSWRIEPVDPNVIVDKSS